MLKGTSCDVRMLKGAPCDVRVLKGTSCDVSMLKGTQSEDVSWPENRENARIIQFADLIFLL